MTSTTIKANILADIKDKVAAGSIDTSDVADNLTDIIDYVDQQVNYKEYVVFFVQSGTNDPVITPINNTIGNVVWARGSAGNFTGTLAGAFPQAKIFFPTRRYCEYSETGGKRNIYMTRSSVNSVSISVNDGSNPIDGLVMYLEIRVYN